MMPIIHLVWIVPASAVFGFILCALLSANGPDNQGHDPKCSQKKEIDGLQGSVRGML